jgi:transposase
MAAPGRETAILPQRKPCPLCDDRLELVQASEKTSHRLAKMKNNQTNIYSSFHS